MLIVGSNPVGNVIRIELSRNRGEADTQLADNGHNNRRTGNELANAIE
jgi:hypothetical protein